jgi:hypothetical protein
MQTYISFCTFVSNYCISKFVATKCAHISVFHHCLCWCIDLKRWSMLLLYKHSVVMLKCQCRYVSCVLLFASLNFTNARFLSFEIWRFQIQPYLPLHECTEICGIRWVHECCAPKKILDFKMNTSFPSKFNFKRWIYFIISRQLLLGTTTECRVPFLYFNSPFDILCHQQQYIPKVGCWPWIMVCDVDNNILTNLRFAMFRKTYFCNSVCGTVRRALE